MIAIDTNVLVRLLLQDDESQGRVAERLFAKAQREHAAVFVADVVLCELVWVLTRRARQPRAGIAVAIESLLDAESVVVADPGAARRALAAYRSGAGDFADYLIREQALAAGASEVATFDRGVRGEPGFKLLG